MVFVHARMATGRVARTLKEMASNKHVSELFMPESTPAYGLAQKQVRCGFRTIPCEGLS